MVHRQVMELFFCKYCIPSFLVNFWTRSFVGATVGGFGNNTHIPGCTTAFIIFEPPYLLTDRAKYSGVVIGNNRKVRFLWTGYFPSLDNHRGLHR